MNRIDQFIDSIGGLALDPETAATGRAAIQKQSGRPAVTDTKVTAYICAYLLRGHLNAETSDETRTAILDYVKSRGMNFSRANGPGLGYTKFTYLETLEMCERLSGERPVELGRAA